MQTNAATTAIEKMTAKGLETMTAIGQGQTSFFDEGIVENSGIWGECLAGELGHKSSGVINRLVTLGLLTDCGDQSEPGFDAGHWYTLTAVGAEVANLLAADSETETDEDEPGTEPAVTAEDFEMVANAVERSQDVTVKVGRIWTYVYRGDVLLAEVRTDSAAAVVAALRA